MSKEDFICPVTGVECFFYSYCSDLKEKLEDGEQHPDEVLAKDPGVTEDVAESIASYCATERLAGIKLIRIGGDQELTEKADDASEKIRTERNEAFFEGEHANRTQG